DAPVTDVRHPVLVGFGEKIGDDGDASVEDGGQSRRGQRPDADEPLPADEGLDDRAAALAVPDSVGVRLLLDKQARAVEYLDNLVTRGEAIESGERPGVFVHGAVEVHNVDDWEAMALANLEVSWVVAGSDLDGAGTKRRINGLVAHNR